MRCHKFSPVVLLAGVVMMAFSQGCSPRIVYERYSVKDSEIGVELDHISGWAISESRGGNGAYSQVMFLEPVRQGKPLRATMVVTTYRSDKVDLKPASNEKFAEDLMAKRLKLDQAKFLGRSEAEFLGSKNIVADFSYRLPDNPESLDAKLIQVTERAIMFLKGDRYYVLRYVNTSVEFNVFEKAFWHCVRTLKFKT